MTDYIFMPSIESFRHINADIRRWCEVNNQPLPVIKFRGTVKLHGTNGAVDIDLVNQRVVAMGRNRVLTLENDNYQFAAFVHNNQPFFMMLARALAGWNTQRVTLYGEWCGEGIQKKVAVSKLSKRFVVFSVLDHTNNKWLDLHDFDLNINKEVVAHLNSNNIFLITQVPTYNITVDFSNPVPAAEEISRLTASVERECPFGKLFGVSGVGEGIVWESYDYPVRFVFKSKGEEHKKTGPKGQVAIDPEKAASLNALVDTILPEWRLEQGISYLRENGFPVAPQSMGAYLKWIAQDVLKEEKDRIEANPEHEWKSIQAVVTQRAKEYLFHVVDVEAGLGEA